MSNAQPPQEKLSTTKRSSALTRRRFGKTALPAVLGSIASTPVLGMVPYNCTVSGQISGNLSRQARFFDCGQLGRSPQEWLETSPWPQGVVKEASQDLTGAAVDETSQNATGSQKDRGSAGPTLFAGRFPPSYGVELKAAFRYIAATKKEPLSRLVVQSDPAFFDKRATVATLHQVLDSSESGAVFELGRATVAALLNALEAEGGPSPEGYSYPLTPDRVIQMFNAVYSGGRFEVVPNVFWGRDRITRYLESLNNPL